MAGISINNILRFLGSLGSYSVIGNKNLGEEIINSAASPDNSNSDSITFSGRKNIDEILELISSSKARCFIFRQELFDQLGKHNLPQEKIIILVDNPRLSFIRLINRFFAPAQKISGIHPTAIISPSATIGERVSIGPYSVIGDNCTIGDDTIIYSHVSIYSGVHIGKRNIIDSNTVIGSEGFGYEKDKNGKYIRFPHLGRVITGNDVEIGANASIDRGSLNDTIIGDGTKIDNSAYIAHGCKIGKNCMIIGHAMLSGSVTVEDDAWISPCVSIRQGIKIGRNSIIGLGAVVVKDVPDDMTVAGNPAKPLKKQKP